MKYARQSHSGAAILHSPQEVEEFIRRRSAAEEMRALRGDIDTLKREIAELKARLEREGK